MIRAEDVADLREGDVVELSDEHWLGAVVRGPLYEEDGDLCVGPLIFRKADGRVRGASSRTLTVVSRAPRPLYVNHPRTEPEPGDVVRNADGGVLSTHWIYMGSSWLGGRHGTPFVRGELPTHLRLLVDGTTGQVVP